MSTETVNPVPKGSQVPALYIFWIAVVVLWANRFVTVDFQERKSLGLGFSPRTA